MLAERADIRVGIGDVDQLELTFGIFCDLSSQVNVLLWTIDVSARPQLRTFGEQGNAENNQKNRNEFCPDHDNFPITDRTP